MGCGGSQLSEADEDEGLPQVGHWDLEHGIDTVSTEKSQTGIVTMNVINMLALVSIQIYTITVLTHGVAVTFCYRTGVNNYDLN